MKILSLLLACAIILGGAGIVSASAKDEIIVNAVSEPATLDPHLQWDPSSYYVYRNIFDNLVTRNNEGEIVPQVALRWDQVSDTEMVFEIRDDIRFHDGEVLGPDDVVFSIKRITDPELGSPQLGQFNKIADAEVLDDGRVKVTTKGPYPALLAQLVKLSIVPEHVVTAVGDDEFNAAPVGSGPYVFDEWVRGVEVRLVRNDNYWGDRGFFESAVFRAVPDAATRVANLRAGAADLVMALNTDLAMQLEGASRGKILAVNTERVAYFAMNLARPPLDDADLRQAISHAINRQAIVDGLLGGFPRVVDQLLSPAHFGWSEGIQGVEYNPEKAREIVAELGDAAKTEMAIATSPIFDQRIVQAIQQMLNDIGLNVSIETTDMSTWLQGQQSTSEQAPMLTFSRWSCTCQDADGIMFPLLHSDSSWSRVSDPEVDAMLDKAREELDPEVRLELYADVNRTILEKVAIVPLYQTAILYGAADELEWTPTSNESMFLNRMSWSSQ
ncbi:ABC transporter substrate-binding protein [Oricola indica]|uniref:ABC transporter substrate-binding protein n=1 Tax=Oricola indica TaxID=2872591 RepID=UPI003CCBE5B6